MEAQIHRALDGLCPLLGLQKPSNEAIRESLLYVRSYEDELAAKDAAISAEATSCLTKKENQTKNQTKSSKAKMEEAGESGKEAKKAKKAVGGGAVRYFGILPEVNLEKVVEEVLEELRGDDVERKESLEKFWKVLKEETRVTARPHVTVMHKNELKEDTGSEDGTVVKGEEVQELRALWDRCAEVYEMSDAPLYECGMEALVWDGRTMAIAIGDLSVEGSPSTSTSASASGDLVEPLINFVDENAAPSDAQRKVLDSLSEQRKSRFHVTVGTRNNDIKPVEAGWLVRRWREAGEKERTFGVDGQEAWCVKLGGEKVKGTLKGLVV